MCSDIKLLNIAINFLPLGANIISVNKDSNLGMRGKPSNNLIVKYTYENIDYTLILENNADYWSVKDVYNELLEKI